MNTYSELTNHELETVIRLRLQRRELYFLHLNAESAIMKDYANRQLAKVNRALYLLTKNEIYL